MSEPISSPDTAALEKELRAKTAQLEAIQREFDQFSHSVSHDLRAPLRALEGFSQILIEDYGAKLDSEGKRCLEILGVSARKASLLIEDLLALSRLFRHHFSPTEFSIREQALRVIEGLGAEAGPARFQVGQLPAAWGDVGLLAQVWERLLENAIKFSRGQPHPQIEVGGQDEAERTVYFVRDNGVGFESKYAERLFGVFQRLHSEQEFPGRGVGLAVVKRVALMHGGEVWAEGKTGGGATFYFSLPKKPAGKRA